MSTKIEVDTGDGFKTVERGSRIKILVDDEVKMTIRSPHKPQTREELILILAQVIDELRPPVVVSYRMM